MSPTLSSIVLAVLALAMVATASAADLLDEARERMEQGELRAAEIQLKNLLREDPDELAALLLLSEIYLGLERSDLARGALQRARRLGAPGAESAPLLARVYLQQHAYSLLLEEVHPEASYPPPVQAEVTALRGQALLGLGRKEQAAEAFDTALDLDADSLYAHLGAARLALENRELDRVRMHLDAVRIVDGANVDLLLIEGELARLQRDPERALEAFSAALERRPSSTLAHLGKAAVLLQQGELQAAERQLEPVLQHTPNHPLANYLRGELAWRAGRTEEAKGAAQLALGFLPGHLPSHLLMGAILHAEGNAEEALPHLTPYVRAVPGHMPARALLAAAQLRVGRASEALQTLAPALEAQPDDVRLLSLAAAASMRAGQVDRATELYARAAELDPEAAELRGRLVVSLLASGRDAAAGKELEHAVDLGLDPVEAGVLRIQLALRKGDYEGALATARELQRSAPDNPIGHNLAGVAHLGAGDREAARAGFQQALAIQPDFTLAAMNLAALELKAGDVTIAEDRFRGILERQPDYVPAAMALVRIARDRGDTAAAVQWAEQARAGDPSAREPRAWLFRYHLDAGRGERALDLAREIVAAHPDWPDAHRMMGQAQQAVKLVKRSLDSFARLVELQPERAANHFLYATAQAEYGDAAGARTSLEQALSLAPDFLQARVALGALEARAERPGAARAIAAEIQQRHPRSAAGFALEGDVLMGQRAYARAADAYSRGYEQEPADQLARKLFRAYQSAGDEKRAHDVLETWLTDHPEDSGMRTLLAQAYHVAGDHAAAMEHYQRLLELEPNRADVLNNLAWISLERQPEQARAWAEQAYDLAPEDPAVMDTYGLVLFHQGQFAEAARILREALLKAPQSSEIRFHLAQALEGTGQWNEARRHVKQVLYTDPRFRESRAAEALLERLEERP